ncbi:MAG: hypothetical protein HQL98_00895 [Magnetococcales bacterium]|nr:hypothetical protein [Magnetococcales bacterium]
MVSLFFVCGSMVLMSPIRPVVQGGILFLHLFQGHDNHLIEGTAFRFGLVSDPLRQGFGKAQGFLYHSDVFVGFHDWVVSHGLKSILVSMIHHGVEENQLHDFSMPEENGGVVVWLNGLGVE